MDTIFLNENEVGRAGAGQSIAYPNLRCCVGVTICLANGSMWGVHVPSPGDDATLLPLLNWVRSKHGDAGSAIDAIYVVGDLGEHRRG